VSSAAAEEILVETAGSGRGGNLRRAFRQGQMKAGSVLVLLILVIAVFGPLFAPHSATEFVGVPAAGPSSEAMFGTDTLGRDVLSRALDGGLTVVWMSLASAILGVAIGLLVGLVAGYSRGWLDELLMRSSDVILAFPQIILALLFVSLAGPKLWLIVVVVAISHAPRVARLVRSLTKDLVKREFVQAAEAVGTPRRAILVHEVMPNLMTPLMVEFGLRLVWSIGIVAGISFIGLGIQPPASDWGLMINENREILTIQPWGVVLPLIFIGVFAIGVNLMTEGYARAAAGVEAREDG